MLLALIRISATAIVVDADVFESGFCCRNAIISCRTPQSSTTAPTARPIFPNVSMTLFMMLDIPELQFAAAKGTFSASRTAAAAITTAAAMIIFLSFRVNLTDVFVNVLFMI